jgi:hypothetical protein
VDAEVVRQLNLLSLTHRRAAETLRNQFASASAASNSLHSNASVSPINLANVANAPNDDDDSSSPRSSDGSAQLVDLNDLLASVSQPRAHVLVRSDDDHDSRDHHQPVRRARPSPFPEAGSANDSGDDDDDDDDVGADDNDDDIVDVEDDGEDSFVGLTHVKAPPVFRESDAPAGAAAELPHSMWGSFERLVGKVLQASAKMLAESVDDRRAAPADSVEAELAKLPRKLSSDSLTDEFVVVRETTPEPGARNLSADPSRSSSPISRTLLSTSLQPPSSPPSRSDTPSVGCTTADEIGALVRQLGDALRRAADDNTSGDDVPINMATLQNAVSALRTAMAWRRRLTLLQTNNEQLHSAVLQLNAEVSRRAQEARSSTPPAAMFASSSHVGGGTSASAENTRLQSEVALLRRQLASVLALTTHRNRAGTPPRKQSRRVSHAHGGGGGATAAAAAATAVPVTTVTPPPPAASAEPSTTAATLHAGSRKSVTFNVPGGEPGAFKQEDTSPASTADARSSEGGGFSERARLTSSEPLLERVDSSPHELSPRRTQQAGAESSETSTTPSGATTPLASSAKDAFGAQQLRQQLSNDTLTSSCDD